MWLVPGEGLSGHVTKRVNRELQSIGQTDNSRGASFEQHSLLRLTTTTYGRSSSTAVCNLLRTSLAQGDGASQPHGTPTIKRAPADG